LPQGTLDEEALHSRLDPDRFDFKEGRVEPAGHRPGWTDRERPY
jgi:hypothetical protein